MSIKRDCKNSLTKKIQQSFLKSEDCTGCPHKENCCKREDNRIVRINEKLNEFHNEVLINLNCFHGALLRTNRSIQAEGTFGWIFDKIIENGHGTS